jgi:hypothetical protein
MNRLIVLLGVLAAVAGVVGQTAWGAAPTIERIPVNEIGVVDEFLSEECGVPVTLDIVGHVTIRTFADNAKGVQRVFTINLELTASAGDNTYRIRDVGADVLRIAPDGTAILMIVGQVPFGFTGALKLNDDTGEAILEPQHSLEERLEPACAILTA